MNKVAKEAITEMENCNLFNDWNLFAYRYPVNNNLKNDLVDDFLSSFSAVCDYQLLNSPDDNSKLNKRNTAVLFLVTSISDFETLLNLNYPEDVPKIIAYFFTPAEFQKISDKIYRKSFKARGFYFVYPNQLTDNLFHACHEKILDTIVVRTVRNKFCGSILGNKIENYTQINPQSVIADMIEIGWYLRDIKLNDSDSFAGAIAIRFGNGVMINASKTDKYHIKSNRVCYVENYVHEKNQIEYIGNFMPSSESLVPYMAFQEFPQINILLHFHYKPMTYSSKLNFYRTNKYELYGTINEAEAIIAKLRETGDFAIACGHGEFIMTQNISEMEYVINKILKRINI